MKTAVRNWVISNKLHMLVWSIYILYETVLIGFVFGIFGHPLTYVLHYLALIGLFYIHANIVLPWSLRGLIGATLRLPVAVASEIWIYILVCFVEDRLLVDSGIIDYDGRLTFDVTFQLKSLYRGLLFVGFATGYYFLKKYNMERERTNLLEQQRLTEIINRQISEQQLAKAENDFLKAQINPHFLFNTLDFIYHDIRQVSPSSANIIIELSAMMRFAIDADKTAGYILLGDEIEQVHHLIHLTQLRKKNKLHFVIDASPETYELYMIPLVLLTLVENIFKHGDLNDALKPASVVIRQVNGNLVICTHNLAARRSNTMSGRASGLNNISQRLNYAYGTQVIFNHHTSEEGYFETSINIATDILKEQPAFLNTSTGTGIIHLHVPAGGKQTTC
jgi:two-component system LytT family sensor kinase